MEKLIEVTRDINTNQTNINIIGRNLPNVPFGRNLDRSHAEVESSKQNNVDSAKSFRLFSN